MKYYTSMTCEEAQIALIKRHINNLYNYNIILEQSDDNVDYFALKELHKEKDGTERETTTKRFRITKATAVVEEYDVITDSYKEILSTLSEEQLKQYQQVTITACK